MFDFNSITEYQVELTSYCNAACPQCPRNNNGAGVNPYMPLCHLSRKTIDRTFDIALCNRISQMFFCGSYGDPIMHPEFLDILRDFRRKNPTLWLYFHTNGGAHTPEYWAEIASIMAGYGQIDFGIDGLEDTLHLYRKNVKYAKVIENAQAFIQAGGSAHWDMLVYEHNEHQVDTAKQLAKELGFSWFRAKVSKRFHTNPVEFLNPPKNYTLPNVTESSTVIDCHALNESSVYVAANGQLLPCCWFGAEVFTLDNEAKNLLADWNNNLVPSWQNQPHRICKSTCSVDTTGTSFSKQWKIEEQLR